ncbi:N-acetylmuramoyl-L-alanine amidase [Bacillus pseudomycoides]|uniref:N-acetylmuramoyl-L-alanine amidase n=1 Tax=Bacillus pseudomycoides TaxID=64104 RepID=A0AA91ZST2_9BACI|nr:MULTISPECIES: N-acetylmuramoyl-L-alanine amidase [Bacillus]PEB56257.1 N-acetylmuramoyl-L-alanine amidase [Bacillus sp. AFS098217]PED81687.1 N-acetylmuramoyl-L-alanine amidase [Bacillus pseudomycoides]
MTRYSNHGGHNEFVQGANYGNRKEHIMDRQVKDAVTAKLRALGHTVYDDTDDVGRTQAQNLNNIVANCNSHEVDLVISYHLNASDGNGHGVEVLYYDQCDLATKVSAQLAKDIGWRDRGAKQRTDLAVLKGTKAPAILIELGFIDNDADMAKWDVDKIANSIVYALTGQAVSSGGKLQPSGDDGRRKIKTGGLGYDAVKEVSEVLCSKQIKGAILFEGEAPYVLTEKLANPKLDDFTAWLDAKNWYWEYN